MPHRIHQSTPCSTGVSMALLLSSNHLVQPRHANSETALHHLSPGRAKKLASVACILVTHSGSKKKKPKTAACGFVWTELDTRSSHHPECPRGPALTRLRSGCAKMCE